MGAQGDVVAKVAKLAQAIAASHGTVVASDLGRTIDGLPLGEAVRRYGGGLGGVVLG